MEMSAFPVNKLVDLSEGSGREAFLTVYVTTRYTEVL